MAAKVGQNMPRARLYDRISVMRLGQFVEEGSAPDIFHAPQHAYENVAGRDAAH